MMTESQNTARLLARVALSAMVMTVLTGCGVRGRPQPPLIPPELGRGEPTFKRASEGFTIPNVPAPESTPDPKSAGGDAE